MAMAKVFIHHGSYRSIPPDSSPGFLFLKSLLPALDSLDLSLHPITPFLTPAAHFIINGGTPTPAGAVVDMMKMRSEKLSLFHHEVKSAWDVEKEDGKRTVMFESVSVTVFKADGEAKKVEVPEFNVVELEPAEGGVEGLKAAELRVYMDAKPVMQRVAEMGKASGGKESKS